MQVKACTHTLRRVSLYKILAPLEQCATVVSVSYPDGGFEDSPLGAHDFNGLTIDLQFGAQRYGPQVQARILGETQYKHGPRLALSSVVTVLYPKESYMTKTVPQSLYLLR